MQLSKEQKQTLQDIERGNVSRLLYGYRTQIDGAKECIVQCLVGFGYANSPVFYGRYTITDKGIEALLSEE